MTRKRDAHDTSAREYGNLGRRRLLKTLLASGVAPTVISSTAQGEDTDDDQEKSLPDQVTANSITIDNGTYRIEVGEQSSVNWEFDGTNTLFFEFFAVEANGDVVGSYQDTAGDIDIIREFPETGDPDEPYTAAIDIEVGGTRLLVERTVELAPDKAAFDIEYTVNNTGPDPADGVTLYQHCDFDIGGFFDDVGRYLPQRDLVGIRDGRGSPDVATGFTGDRPSESHHVAAFPARDATLSGSLNNNDRYPNSGVADPVVVLSFQLGDLDDGDRDTVTVSFGAGSSFSEVGELVGQAEREVRLAPEFSTPVQLVGDTRIAGPPSVEVPDPRLVPGRQTAFLFGLEVTGRDAFAADDTVTLDVSVANGPSQSVELTTADIDDLNVASLERRALADALSDADVDPPVFELPPDAGDITVEIDPDVDGDGEPELPSQTQVFSRGEDFDVATPTVSPEIAVAELRDPEGGENFGSNNDGRVIDFDEAVENVAERFASRFPVDADEVAVKKLSQPVDALVDPPRVDVPNEINKLFVRTDAERVYDALSEEFAFNAALALVPTGYFKFNNFDFLGLEFTGRQTAALARTTLTAPADPEIALHELAHHYAPLDLYPKPAAQRDADKATDADFQPEIDRNHARTLNRNWNNDNTIDDAPGLVSTGFTLDDGNYGILNDKVLLDSKALNESIEPGKANPVLSYASGPIVVDPFLNRPLTDPDGDGYVPRPPESGDGGTQSTLSFTAGRGEDSFELASTSIDESVASATFEEGSIAVTVAGDDGTVLSERQLPGSYDVSPYPATGTPSVQTFEDVYAAAVPFPAEAVTLRLEDTEAGFETEFAPLTRTVRDLIDRIPDGAFIPDPGGSREELNNRLDAIERHISNQRYRPARNGYQSLATTIDSILRDEYETTAAQEPTKAEVLNTIDDRIDRVTALLESNGGGKGGR